MPNHSWTRSSEVIRIEREREREIKTLGPHCHANSSSKSTVVFSSTCAWYVDELLRQRAAVYERDELVGPRPGQPMLRDAGRFAKAGQARLATVAGRSQRLVDLPGSEQ